MTTSIMRGGVRWGVALAASAAIALGGAALFAPQAQAAESIPIKSVDDFKELVNNNPTGNYYLANDIDFAGEAYEVLTPFKGTLDGKGYSIKNYNMTNGLLTTKTQVLFQSADGATFKNITLSGYKADINSKMKGNLKIAGLVRTATKCAFNNVTVSGAITVNSPNRDAFAGDYIAGIAAVSTGSTFKSCTSKVKITVSNTNSEGAVGGIIANGQDNTFSSCTNGAAISVTGMGDEGAWVVCGISASENTGNKFTSCKNTAAISYTATAPKRSVEMLGAAGIANTADSLTGCVNSGKVTVNATKITAKLVGDDTSGAAGVALSSFNVDKCGNTAAVTYKGPGNRLSGGLVYAMTGGVVAKKGTYSQTSTTLKRCYNTGKVSVTLTTGFMAVGGVAGEAAGAANNCYNTGAVSGSKAYCVGGVFGYLDPNGKKVTAFYNMGKVSGTGEAKNRTAAIAGLNEGTVTNAYYTSSGKGIVNDSGAKGSAKKVSSITFGNCPGLSSTYWKSKSGKLILKWQ